MPNSNNSSDECVSSICLSGQREAKEAPLIRLVHYLVFEAPAVRLGLELTLSTVLYIVLSLAFPWQLLEVSAKWASLYSWFIACSSVLLVDQSVLCRSSFILREAFLLSLQGQKEKATMLLESIAPASGRSLPLPASVYHLSQATFLMHAGEHRAAGSALMLARQTGLPDIKFYIAREQLKRSGTVIQGNRPEKKLEKAPQLLLEKAVSRIEGRTDWWESSEDLKQVLKLGNEAHPCGETTHCLAAAYLAVCDLWRGRAEEGLVSLGRSIAVMKSSAYYVERLRPVIANLLLERAYYFATHRDSNGAVLDYNQALALARVSSITSVAVRLREELTDRFGIELAQ